jgi:glycosyltransferase involved in cell wall biosynthesis
MYDFQYLHLPLLYTEEQRREFADRDRRGAERASLVLVISEASLRDFRAALPDLAGKARLLRVCSAPTAEWWQRQPAEVVTRYDLPQRFFLISNQVCAHKNHRTIFEAVRALRRDGAAVNVVCTGRQADYRDRGFYDRLAEWVRANGLDGAVRFLGAVPRADYVALLRQAVAVVQPSEFEGWGFAVADAKVVGKPVLASDLPVHHEHGAPVHRYVAPLDVDGWKNALRDAVQNLGHGPDPFEARAVAENEVEQRQVGAVFAGVLREAMALAGAMR